jgi:hypothetical protein
MAVAMPVALAVTVPVAIAGASRRGLAGTAGAVAVAVAVSLPLVALIAAALAHDVRGSLHHRGSIVVAMAVATAVTGALSRAKT